MSTIKMTFKSIFAAVFLSTIVASLQSLITENTYKWMVKKYGDNCSQPCGGGYRNISYQCIVYHDPTGVTKSADDEDCKDVRRPPVTFPCNQHACQDPFPRERRTVTGEKPRFEWITTGQWSDCINGCIKGKQCQLIGCYDNTRNEWLDDAGCAKVRRPAPVCSPCRDYMSCPAVWSVSGWSPCSRTCGGGRRVRTASCIRRIGRDSIMTVADDQCEGRPSRLETCAVTDCPPTWRTSKWSPCKGATSWTCGRGTRKRKVVCARMNKTGRVEKMSFKTCFRLYGKAKYPRPWEPCRDYRVQLSEKCKAKQKDSDIFIHENNATVVQMKRIRRMTLQVGETALIFPGTNIVIKCPVSGFDERDLTWLHNGRPLALTGRRVHMNYRGRLKIRRLTARDEGSWRCMAGNRSAEVSIRLRQPSQGFRSYAVRLPLIVMEAQNRMVADAPGSGTAAEFTAASVVWVAGEWGSCSASCGPKGTMTRKVRCERLKDSFFKVFDDSACLRAGLKKPKEVRDCGGITCPKWTINSQPGVCTDVCSTPGNAILKDKLYCTIGQQLLPKDKCSIAEKPQGLDLCNNTDCQPKWNVSDWSKCSRSCGGRGVKARHLSCVWKKSGLNAGSNCYALKLKKPKLLKTCHARPCILACVDISPRCKRIQSRLCKFRAYQRFCCNTCVNALRRRLMRS